MKEPKIEEIEGVKFINCMLNDIVFVDNKLIEANDYDFVKNFYVNIYKNEILSKGKLKIFRKKITVDDDVSKKVSEILSEYPDVYFIVSSKTARAYKNPQMVVAERNQMRKCKYEFEIL